jgi:hypothetical protein
VHVAQVTTRPATVGSPPQVAAGRLDQGGAAVVPV